MVSRALPTVGRACCQGQPLVEHLADLGAGLNWAAGAGLS